MHLNDPNAVAARALELAVDDKSELRFNTRAGFGNAERALVIGVTHAICEMLRDMFAEGVAIDQAAKEEADELYAKSLEQREADLEERENALAARQAALGLNNANESILAVAEATPAPTGNDGVEDRVAADEKLRQESIDSAAVNADVHADEQLSDPHPSDTDAEPGDTVETGPGPSGEAAGEEVAEVEGVDNADVLDPTSMSYAELQEYAEAHGVSKTDEGGKMRSKATLLQELGKLSTNPL